MTVTRSARAAGQLWWQGDSVQQGGNAMARNLVKLPPHAEGPPAGNDEAVEVGRHGTSSDLESLAPNDNVLTGWQ